MSDVGSALNFDVVCADIVAFPADVIALKYAQDLHGADKQVVECLRSVLPNIDSVLPHSDAAELLPSRGTLASKFVLLVGTVPLTYLRYQQIRDFGRSVIEHLARVAPKTEHLAMTIHGVRYGLDEFEAFKAQIAGITEAVTIGRTPAALKKISIVELDQKRASRLKQFLSDLPKAGSTENQDSSFERSRTNLTDELRGVGYRSEDKAHVFVAMPFTTEMDDVYHYGIVGAVRQAGFVCERADLSSFTGDILQWVRDRIRSASLVIADLSSANPNVYLEVGYAWGCNIPTILLASKNEDLKFDVRGQRCLLYKSIRNLEQLLTKELQNLPVA